MELGFFEHVAEVARNGLDTDGQVHMRAHRGGVKVWFGPDERAAREHYEAQLVSRRHLDGEAGVVLEIGFHAEHRDAAANEAALERLLATKSAWAKTLGKVAMAPDEVTHDTVIADRFLGNDTWRRLSETWEEPDLEDPELSIEAGARLADYINTFQPILDSAS